MTRLPSVVAVYGAGTFGQQLAGDLRKVGIEVPVILDRQPRVSADGTAVVDPYGDVDRSLPIAIGVCNPGVDIAKLTAELHTLGHESVFSPVQVYAELGLRGIELSHYWLTTNLDIYRRATEPIAAARALLSDERSRRLYDEILNYRRDGDAAAMEVPDPLREQYLPADLPFMTGAVRLVDCGAYDGDTVRAYLAADVRLEAIAALEPDPVNFAALVEELAKHPDLDAVAVPLGASDRSRQVKFRADGTSGATISADGTVTIQCVSLDELLHGWHPSHVKMDIEGAEGDALAGMTRIIGQDRPALAISIYHRPEDLWELILQVDTLMSPSRMHIRVYGHQGFDTVLYAMP